MSGSESINFWIFQAVLEQYPLPDVLIKGRTVTWYATRYRDRMSPEDIVFFWLGGAESIRGIYGWGRIKSFPYLKSEWESYGVDVEYEERLEPHLSVRKIKSVPELQNLLILRAPQATNFLLSPIEARAITNLIERDQRPQGF